MDSPAEWMQFQLPSAMVEQEVFAAANSTEIIFTFTFTSLLSIFQVDLG